MALSLEEGSLGNSTLVSKDLYNKIEEKDIIGEEAVLTNPIYDRAFAKMAQDFRPKNKVALVSLCTWTRPYNLSPKWSSYKKDIKDVDFIVASNGGVIPEDYWHENIYLVYDAPARGSEVEKMAGLDSLEYSLTKEQTDYLYSLKLYNRLVTFFKNNKYDYVFGDFVPKQRNYFPFVAAMELLKSLGYIVDFDAPREDIPYEQKGRNYPNLEEPYYSEKKKKIERLKES